MSPTEKIRFKCSVCGKAFSVSPKYAGKRGKCPGCGQTITIPAIEEPADISSQLKSAEEHHNEQKEAEIKTEAEIKKPPPMKTPKSVANIFRMGNTMVMQRDTALPDRCLKTNKTENLRFKRITLRWHNPLLYLTILAGLLVYVIVAVICTKKAKIEVPVSRRILTRNLICVLVTWVCTLSSIFFIGYGIVLSGSSSNPDNIGSMFLFAVLLLITAAIVYAIGGRIITAMKIDDYYVWIKGVNRDYLSELPQWQGQYAYVPAGSIPSAAPVASKKCNQCGTDVLVTDKFCLHCGINLK